jgi:hypothetical protein
MDLLRRTSPTKSNLKTTPRRAAIEYITSIHRTAEAEGIKVLARQIEEMQANVQEFIFLPICKDGVLNQTCFLVELYCFAVNELSTALTSMMELNTFVSAYSNFQPSPCSWLFDQMARAYNALQLDNSTVDLIEETHLRSLVLPRYYVPLVDLQLELCESLRALVADDPNQATKDLHQPDENLESEQGQMRTYVSVIRTRTNLKNASLSGVCLAHAEHQVCLCYSRYKQYAELLTARHSDKIRPEKLHYLVKKTLEIPVSEDNDY